MRCCLRSRGWGLVSQRCMAGATRFQRSALLRTASPVAKRVSSREKAVATDPAATEKGERGWPCALSTRGRVSDIETSCFTPSCDEGATDAQLSENPNTRFPGSSEGTHVTWIAHYLPPLVPMGGHHQPSVRVPCFFVGDVEMACLDVLYPHRHRAHSTTVLGN